MISTVWNRVLVLSVITLGWGIIPGNVWAQPPAPAQTNAVAPKEIIRYKSMTLEELMDVVVTTVLRKESTVGNSPAAVFVVTPEMIRRSGATTIAELFRMVPGMNVARLSNRGWAVSARGFNDVIANKLLVLVDGRTVYTPCFAGVYWDIVDYPLQDLDRIEVIRGPGGSCWGANAVNGVVNIITKSAKDTQGGVLQVGGGLGEQDFGSIRYGGKGEQAGLYYRVYAKGYERDLIYNANSTPPDPQRGRSTGVRLDWEATPQDTVTLQGDSLQTEANKTDLRPMVTPPYRFWNVDVYNSESGNVLGRWTHTINENSKWVFQAYWDHFEIASRNSMQNMIQDTYDVDFQHQFTWSDRQTVVFGAGYRQIDIWDGGSMKDNGFVIHFDHTNYLLELYSAFLQDQVWLIPDRLSITLGSKLEHNSFTGVEIEPSARLLWTPTRYQSFWLAASRAVRTPSNGERESSVNIVASDTDPVVFEQLRPNPELDSEIVHAYELGYRIQATESISADLALFANQYSRAVSFLIDPLSTNNIPPGTLSRTRRYSNGPHVETYGAELSLAWRPTTWCRLQGAYTYLQMDYPPDSELPTASHDAKYAPKNEVYLQASFDLPRNVEFDLMGRYVSVLHTSVEIPAYMTLDARLAWRLRPSLEFAVVGQNLLDKSHPEAFSTYMFSPDLTEIQRSVYGTLTYWW